MPYKVQLVYFRQTGKYLSTIETTIDRGEIAEIWKEVDDARRLGQLPGLRPGAGRDLFIMVNVLGHPQRVLHLVMPSCMDEDDVTPPHVSTGEMPLVRMPLDEIPRTSTRDVVKIDLDADPDADTAVIPDDDVTPVDRPIPKRPKDE